MARVGTNIEILISERHGKKQTLKPGGKKMFREPQLKFHRCPRCKEKAYELYNGHDSCHACNYSSDISSEPKVPLGLLDIVKSAWIKADLKKNKGAA